jgi:hypothetical protein
MLSLAFCLLLSSGGGVAPLASPLEGQPSLEWKSRSYDLEDLPEELGPGPAAAAGAWADWVLEHNYQMHLDADGRVLLISSKKNRKWKRQLRLIAETSELFDELLPLPSREEAQDAADEPQPEDGEPLPEDPEGGPVGWGSGGSKPTLESYSYEWGAGTWPLETETCVMFVAHNEEDYGALLAHLGELESYLKPWLKSAGRFAGFVLEKPLIGAYIENASGMEEWDPENEVVNRVAQMLFVRRFSQQPFWLLMGLAWHMEMEIRRGIYSFPYREGFVWASEHTAWASVLRVRFGARKQEPLGLDEFAHWKRGEYIDEQAKVSFGLVRFFVRHHRMSLSAFVEELRLFRGEHSRVDLGDGTWQFKPDYRVSDADLTRLLKAHFRPSILQDAADYFRKGERYRLSRP